MTMVDTARHTAAATSLPGRIADRATGGFAARAVSDWASVAERSETGIDLPFQNRIWIESWYQTIGAAATMRPLPIEVRDRDGRLAALLPLVLVDRDGRRIITFADEELTDYNAPLLGPAAPADRAGAARLWQAVRAALPAADLFVLRKSPYQLASRPNPLALLPGAGLCAANGNLIVTGDRFADYHRGLGKPVRSEFDRCWRVFSRDAPGARYVSIADPGQADRYLAAMDQQQRARFAETGAPFSLDTPQPAAFYRTLAARGLSSGYTYIGALECDAGIVATIMAFVQGRRMIVTRISNAGGAWSNISPGRLVLYRAMMDLHGKGVREFDFSIGNYDYKRRFKVEPFPLFDLYIPLSWKGIVPTARARAAAGLRQYPGLDARLRRMLRV